MLFQLKTIPSQLKGRNAPFLQTFEGYNSSFPYAYNVKIVNSGINTNYFTH